MATARKERSAALLSISIAPLSRNVQKFDRQKKKSHIRTIYPQRRVERLAKDAGRQDLRAAVSEVDGHPLAMGQGPVGTKLQYEDIRRWALPELRPARRMQQDLLPVAS